MKVELDSYLSIIIFEDETWTLNVHCYIDVVEKLLSPSQFERHLIQDFRGEVSMKRYNSAKIEYEKQRKIFRMK